MMLPVLLAIVGDSAAGKTTFAAGIMQLLGPDRVTCVCTDDYHRYDRAQRKELEITPLDPACNYLDVLGQHLRLLAAGEPVLKPVYQHHDGTFGAPEYVVPRQFMIMEGLLALHTRRMREPFAVSVYLDPPEDLRRRWKVQRDTAKRGYTPEQVQAELERREPDSAAFIRPQRRGADVIVQFLPPTGRSTAPGWPCGWCCGRSSPTSEWSRSPRRRQRPAAPRSASPSGATRGCRSTS